MHFILDLYYLTPIMLRDSRELYLAHVKQCSWVQAGSGTIYTMEHGRFARWRKWRACDVGEAKRLENELILQDFRHFTYVIAHSPTLPSLYLRHSSFSNPSVASPTSQLILQPFFRFSYVTGEQSSFSKISVTSPTWQLILQPFRHFTYITTHSPTLPLLHLRHSSFFRPSFPSLKSQVFTYVTWRAAHDSNIVRYSFSKSRLCSIKIIKFWQLIGWQFQNSTKKTQSLVP